MISFVRTVGLNNNRLLSFIRGAIISTYHWIQVLIIDVIAEIFLCRGFEFCPLANYFRSQRKRDYCILHLLWVIWVLYTSDGNNCRSSRSRNVIHVCTILWMTGYFRHLRRTTWPSEVRFRPSAEDWIQPELRQGKFSSMWDKVSGAFSLSQGR